MRKNVAGQKWVVFAFNDTTNTPVTGDANNITASIAKDGDSLNALTELHPTELGLGYYIFTITQVESNGNLLLLCPVSTTTNVQIMSVPSSVWTELTAMGSGIVTWPYTLTDAINGQPIVDADVWVTTDSTGVNVIASGVTNQSGAITFYLDAGSVYVWSQKTGYNFSNPNFQTVS